jgi:uroporphyrinogen-III decarboxylase
MDRSIYLQIAQDGLTMPVAVDLVLHEDGDAQSVERVLNDGQALGRLVVRTARRFGVPLALPHMDLTLEKQLLLQGRHVDAGAAAAFHFKDVPTEAEVQAMVDGLAAPLPPGLRAQEEAVRFVSEEAPDLVPCAMTIGPFSLMTTLLDDPISAVYLATMGTTAKDDPAVALLDIALDLSIRAVERSLRAQLEAGAKLAVLCEPAVNKVYLSPRQMKASSTGFDRLVMANLRRYKSALDEHGADLFLHDCGELTGTILSALVELDPAIVSLGSSESLWEAAKIVPQTTVLYGNLPSKQFYSDRVISEADVAQRAQNLIEHMNAIGRPFILGTECDVLYVSGAESAIWAKLDVMGSVRRKLNEDRDRRAAP